MATVFKRGGKANRKGVYYVQWYDHEGKRRTECTGTTDKATADRLAAKYQDEVAQRERGLIDPAAEKYAQHGRRPIAEHVADFRAELEARGNDADYINQTMARVEAVIGRCSLNLITELQASEVNAAIKRLRDAGRSIATCNTYLRSIKGFSSWLKADKRLRDDPLTVLHLGNEATDPRHPRRELSLDEFMRLLESTESYTHHAHALNGPDRAMVYRLAAGTGFRAKELRSLTPASFNLDGNPPTITVEASCSKRRREDEQPIRDDFAALLRPWLAGRSAREPIFANLPDDTVRMLRGDLAFARKAWIASATTDAEREALREVRLSGLYGFSRGHSRLPFFPTPLRFNHRQ